MSILSDIDYVNRLLKSMADIRKPEDLTLIIQEGKDVLDKHISEIKGIPGELERWQDVAKDLGLLSENTDLVAGAKDLLFREVVDSTKETMIDSVFGLSNSLSIKDSLLGENVAKMSIGGVKIDYLYSPTPEYSTYAVSQPIISSSNLDVLSEHAENENTTLAIKCVLTGEDKQARFDQINTLRENKQIVQVVANEVYDRMLITRIKPIYNNSSDLEFTINFENVFIAQLKRATARKEQVKKTTNKSEIPKLKEQTKKINVPEPKPFKPIPPEMKPAPSVYDMLKQVENNGFVTPIDTKLTDYKNEQWRPL